MPSFWPLGWGYTRNPECVIVFKFCVVLLIKLWFDRGHHQWTMMMRLVRCFAALFCQLALPIMVIVGVLFEHDMPMSIVSYGSYFGCLARFWLHDSDQNMSDGMKYLGSV